MVFSKTRHATKQAASEARDTVRNAAEAAQSGVEESRKTAAGVLVTAGKRVRGGSRRAARTLHRTGSSVADKLEDTGHRVEPARAGPAGYARRHPMRFALFLGLVAGFVVVLWFRRRNADSDDDMELEFSNPAPTPYGQSTWRE